MSAYKTSIFNLISTGSLAIPNYQRPYKWAKRNIEELLADISRAIEESLKYGEFYKYRIGTILIHEHPDGHLYIVDGQQRIISVTLICLFLFPTFHSDLTDHHFSDDISKQNIRENYMFIRQWFSLKSDEEKERFRSALKDIIEVVVITVKEESEAFQLFDSQNSRGRALYPHDLLKAYHLREMSSTLFEMEHAVKKWEDRDPSEIKELFTDFLFPIINWTEKQKSDTFSDRYIDIFKGTDIKDTYTYALRAFKSSPFFQVTEPFIAGGDFFDYVEHYLQLLHDIRKELLERNDDYSEFRDILLSKDSRLKYCSILFYCATLCYYDRFHTLDKMAILRLFTWAFMIRIDMLHLGYDTINKYAIGEYNDLYFNTLPVFYIISKARKPSEIENLTVNIRLQARDNENQWLADRLKTLNGLQ